MRVKVMHFEVLVEDLSGKRLLESILPPLMREDTTFRVTSYRGVGRIPRGLNPSSDPAKRILLTELPRLIRGYGIAFAHDPPEYRRCVVVVFDLDSRDKTEMLSEIQTLLDAVAPRPETRFCLAIEEGEAWLLSDQAAVKKAYPRASNQVLNSYVPDTICGTWEKLADAVYPGGARELKAQGWQAIGTEKSRWAAAIAPHLTLRPAVSPSLNHFVQRVDELATLV